MAEGDAGWTPETWSAAWDEQRIGYRTMYLTSLALDLWQRPEEDKGLKTE